jgi:hypothetical protein
VYASGVAFFATGLSVSAGLAGHHETASGALVNLTAAGTAKLTDAELAAREQSASRSSDDRRVVADSLKAATFSPNVGVAVTKTEDLGTADPQALTRVLMPRFGLDPAQFGCIDNIWSGESGWRVHAANPSGAYGIPQALPGSKMASAGPDWQNNAGTQIKWGLEYIAKRYGTACAAWSFKQANGWY